MRRNNAEFGLLATNQKMKINYSHQVLGHPGMVKTIATAKHLGWLVETNNMKCIDCQIGKAKQKNLNKTTENTATEILERLCIDTSSMKVKI